MPRSRLVTAPLDASGLARALELGGRSLDGFSTSLGDREETFSFETAELSGSVEIPGVTDVVVEGRVDKKAPWEALREAMSSGAEPLGGIGMLSAYVGFEEANSKQTAAYCDLASVGVSRGEPLFAYAPSGSRVASDRAYRRQFMERVASSGLLPIEFVDGEYHFTLVHAAGERLLLTRSEGGGRNPSAFRCFRPGPVGGELIDLLRRFVTELGSGKTYLAFWKVNVVRRTEPEAERAESAELYSRLRSLGLPAKSYQLSVTVRIDSPERLVELPALCGPKDVHEVGVATFRSGRKAAEMSAVVRREGVRLRVESSGELDAASLSDALGTRLEAER